MATKPNLSPREIAAALEFDQNGPRGVEEAGSAIFNGVVRHGGHGSPSLAVGLGAGLGAAGAVPLAGAGAVYRALMGRKNRSDEEMSELARESGRSISDVPLDASPEATMGRLMGSLNSGLQAKGFKTSRKGNHVTVDKAPGYKAGGSVKSKGDGIAQRGKTRGKVV